MAGAPALGGTGLLVVFVGLASGVGVGVGGGSLGPSTGSVLVGLGEEGISVGAGDAVRDGAQPWQQRKSTHSNMSAQLMRANKATSFLEVLRIDCWVLSDTIGGLTSAPNSGIADLFQLGSGASQRGLIGIFELDRLG